MNEDKENNPLLKEDLINQEITENDNKENNEDLDILIKDNKKPEKDKDFDNPIEIDKDLIDKDKTHETISNNNNLHHHKNTNTTTTNKQSNKYHYENTNTKHNHFIKSKSKYNKNKSLLTCYCILILLFSLLFIILFVLLKIYKKNNNSNIDNLNELVFIPALWKQQNKNVTYFKTKNNLECLLISDLQTSKSSVALSVQVGSIKDYTYNIPGLSHFLEHMLFLKNNSEFLNYIASKNGKSNAYTNYETMTFYMEVPTGSASTSSGSNSSNDNSGNLNNNPTTGGGGGAGNDADFVNSINLFAQIFINSFNTFYNENAIENEIQNINSEHMKNIDSDSWKEMQILKMNAKINSFAMFNTGNKEILSKDLNYTISQSIKLYNKYFYSENMKLVIYSNESVERLKKIIYKTGFKNLNTKEDIKNIKYSKTNKNKKNKEIDLNKDTTNNTNTNSNTSISTRTNKNIILEIEEAEDKPTIEVINTNRTVLSLESNKNGNRNRLKSFKAFRFKDITNIKNTNTNTNTHTKQILENKFTNNLSYHFKTTNLFYNNITWFRSTSNEYSISLYFNLPNTILNHTNKEYNLIKYILNYNNNNSLHDFLYSNFLIYSLNSDFDYSYSSFSIFSINIKLTNKGYFSLKLIITKILDFFKYLLDIIYSFNSSTSSSSDILRNEFQNLIKTNYLKYTYASTSSNTNEDSNSNSNLSVEKLAESLLYKYNFTYAIKGEYIHKYDSKKFYDNLSNILRFYNIDNLVVIYSSRNYDYCIDDLKKEEYYGFDYYSRSMDEFMRSNKDNSNNDNNNSNNHNNNDNSNKHNNDNNYINPTNPRSISSITITTGINSILKNSEYSNNPSNPSNNTNKRNIPSLFNSYEKLGIRLYTYNPSNHFTTTNPNSYKSTIKINLFFPAMRFNTNTKKASYYLYSLIYYERLKFKLNRKISPNLDINFSITYSNIHGILIHITTYNDLVLNLMIQILSIIHNNTNKISFEEYKYYLEKTLYSVNEYSIDAYKIIQEYFISSIYENVTIYKDLYYNSGFDIRKDISYDEYNGEIFANIKQDIMISSSEIVEIIDQIDIKIKKIFGNLNNNDSSNSNNNNKDSKVSFNNVYNQLHTIKYNNNNSNYNDNKNQVNNKASSNPTNNSSNSNTIDIFINKNKSNTNTNSHNTILVKFFYLIDYITNIEKTTILNLINLILNNEIHYILRTNEALGYTVFSTKELIHDQAFYTITVQSSTHNSKYIIQKITHTIEEYLYKKVFSLNDSTLNQYKKIIEKEIAREIDSSNYVNSSLEYYWDFIINNTLDFDNKKKIMSKIKGINSNSIKEFYNEYLVKKKRLTRIIVE